MKCVHCDSTAEKRIMCSYCGSQFVVCVSHNITPAHQCVSPGGDSDDTNVSTKKARIFPPVVRDETVMASARTPIDAMAIGPNLSLLSATPDTPDTPDISQDLARQPATALYPALYNNNNAMPFVATEPVGATAATTSTFASNSNAMPPVETESAEATNTPPIGSISSVMQVLVSLQSAAQSSPNSALNRIPGTTVSCSLSDTKATIHWVPGTDSMQHTVRICADSIADFGNGFARMRVVEQGLQASTGIKIKAGAAVSGSPNNALGELRLLISNPLCEYRQLIVSFADMQNRRLLYRSTGGRVMEYVNDGEGEGAKKVKKVKTVSLDGANYVYTGAFSICNGGTEAVQQKWASDHDLDYMRKMAVMGKAGEHFHHSEQSFFRLLYDYADRLPGMIEDHLIKGESVLGIDGHFTVNVISADIFTTRAACSNCVSSSVILHQAGHFFEKFISALGRSTRFSASSSLSSLVRIDCAVGHSSTPVLATSEGMPSIRRGTVHAMPPLNVRSTSSLEGSNLVSIQLQIPVNQAAFILQAGGDKRHWTLIELHLKTLWTLGGSIASPDNIFEKMSEVLSALIEEQFEPDSTPEAKKPRETFLLIVLELTKRLEPKEEERLAKHGPLPYSSNLLDQRVLQVLKCNKMADKRKPNPRTPVCSDEFALWVIIRHYKQFGFDDLAAAKRGIRSVLVRQSEARFSGLASAYYGSELKALWDGHERIFDEQLIKVKEHVTAEIRDLCLSTETGALEEAEALAHDFELGEIYESAVNGAATRTSDSSHP